MMPLRHSIRRETLEVAVADETLAFALQPRLAELNRKRLLPAIERLLDELSLPGQHLRIDRVDVDLGVLAAGDLEREAEERLVRALRHALGGMTAIPEAHAVRELFERLLLHGTLPFWATGECEISLERIFLAMAEDDPEGVVAVVRNLGRYDFVLERLAAQLSETSLRQLVRLLEPRYATLILEYVDDLEDVHRGEPLLPLSDAELARDLWVLVEAYLVQDPGSQFNRRSFVKSLLEGLAASEGLEYAEILGALRVGLERSAQRHPLRSSLPAVVAELVRELDAEETPTTQLPDETERLPPRDAEAVRELLQLLARIPAPYRPRPEDRVRQVVLAALLARDQRQPIGEAFYATVLAELFAWPLAAPVSRFLFVETEENAPFRAAVVAASRDELLAESDSDDALRRQAKERRTRERWASTMSEEELVRVAAALEPRRHRLLLAAAEVLAAAWRETSLPEHPALTERLAFWRFMLDFLTRTPAAGRSTERLVAAFFEHSAARTIAVSPVAPELAREGERLLDRAGHLARSAGQTVLLGILHRDRRLLLAPWERVRVVDRVRRRKELRDVPDANLESDPLYIDNAGLVLTAAFLPQLFAVLDLLVEEEGRRPALCDRVTASRAVHLLQYLADGRTSLPEPLLVLNKILCGLPTAMPVEREIELSERERDVCDTLLRSVIAAWKSIANTSVAGLQEGFLRREGKLQRTDDGWKLTVQRKTIDFLIDELPWSVSVIFLRWMPQPLYVSW